MGIRWDGNTSEWDGDKNHKTVRGCGSFPVPVQLSNPDIFSSKNVKEH